MAKPSKDAQARVPRHPSVVLSGVLCVVLTIAGLLSFWALAPIPLALRLIVALVLFGCAGILAYALWVATPVQHVNSAHNALSAGQTDTAQAHLAIAERSRAGIVRIAVGVNRAQLDMHRADLDQAIVALDKALSVRVPWIGRFQAKLNLASARAMRSLAHALKGQETEARRDLESLKLDAHARVDALTYGALAEAILLHRARDSSALRAHLEHHRMLLFEYTRPRERALVRALRWSTRRPSTPYRTAAAPTVDERRAGVAHWLEAVLPGSAEWLPGTRLEAEPSDSVAPDAAAEPLLSKSAASSAGAATRPPLGVDSSVGEPLMVAMPARARPSLLGFSLRTLLVLWLGLIVSFLAVQHCLSPVGVDPAALPTEEVTEVSLRQDLPWQSWLVLAIAAAAFLGVRRHAQHVERSLVRAARLTGVDLVAARDLLVRLTRARSLFSPFRLVRSQAHLVLARLAERAAQFDVAVAHVDAAFTELRVPGHRSAGYDFVLPELHALRAFAWAGLDRPADATAELDKLEHEFPAFCMRECAVVRVRQLLAVRSGDYEAAARIASERSPDLPISYRDDVLGELAELVVRKTAINRQELDRLRHEIEDDSILAHWLNVTAPELVRRYSDIKPS